MNIIIRTDSSIEIGSGHVMRCLTIAKKLRKEGCCVKFWMEPLLGNLIDYVNQEGFENLEEATFADIYIIDHYKLGIEWERNIRLFTKKVVVIDDLARTHDCDLLLDQNIVPNYETRYDGKVSPHCVKLLGPKYLIMRDEFIEARAKSRTRSVEVRRLLIFMGGSDPTNETFKVLEALRANPFGHIDVVVGYSNPMKDIIREICLERGYSYHCQIDYMATLMQLADFAVGAGGVTTWERCYVGLPSSATIVADNQRETTAYAASLGVVKNLGWHKQVTVDTYKQLFKNLSIDNMSEKGIELTATLRPNAWINEILELKI